MVGLFGENKERRTFKNQFINVVRKPQNAKLNLAREMHTPRKDTDGKLSCG